MKAIILPVGLVAVIGCMLLPLPPFAVDCLLVVNLIFSVLLVASALYLSNPIKLSSLPTILLLATLYRLALNISTTRRILGSGEAGEMIEMFGKLLMQGEMFVGLVVFLVLTLVQFIVIAKGSERVAEVSARFTLDALPGKQMSIDADIRSGLLDVETAKIKREELQLESRFYGALDGAMKFVKGDAIAGIVITAVNILGGLAVGLLVQGLPVWGALQKYTLLTLGDGLLSQIPALLNSLAAGLIVTRVAKEESDSLAAEVLDQIGSIKPALILSGVVSLLLALVGVATLPFVALSVIFLFLGFLPAEEEEGETVSLSESFTPTLPSLFTVELPVESHIRRCSPREVQKTLSATLQSIYADSGLLLVPPTLSLSDELETGYRLLFRGVPELRKREWSKEGHESADHALGELGTSLEEFIKSKSVQSIDDIFTRRALDHLEQAAPELVSNTVPGVISVTQLTTVLRRLVQDGLSIRSLDVILQVAAEQCMHGFHLRPLLEEVRIALSRSISLKLAEAGVLSGFRLDPVLDLWIAECERGQSTPDPRMLLQVEEQVITISKGKEEQMIIVCSRSARRLLQECFEIRGINHVVVLAEEEISQELTWVENGSIRLPEEEAEELFTRLAA